MKRFLKSTIVILTLSCLIACGKESPAEVPEPVPEEKVIPSGYTEELYDLGMKAVDIMRAYNLAEMDADECYIQLKTIQEKADAIHNDPTQPEDVQYNALAIAASCFSFNNSILEDKNESVTILSSMYSGLQIVNE